MRAITGCTKVSNGTNSISCDMYVFAGGSRRGVLRLIPQGKSAIVGCGIAFRIVNQVTLDKQVFLGDGKYSRRSTSAPPAKGKAGMTDLTPDNPIVLIPAGMAMQDDTFLYPIDPAVFYRDVVVAGHIGGSGERTLLTKVDAYPRLGFVAAIDLYVSDGDPLAGIGMEGIVRNQADDADVGRGRTSRKFQEPVRPTVNRKVIHSREPKHESAAKTCIGTGDDGNRSGYGAINGERDIILPHS